GRPGRPASPTRARRATNDAAPRRSSRRRTPCRARHRTYARCAATRADRLRSSLSFRLFFEVLLDGVEQALPARTLRLEPHLGLAPWRRLEPETVGATLDVADDQSGLL